MVQLWQNVFPQSSKASSRPSTSSRHAFQPLDSNYLYTMPKMTTSLSDFRKTTRAPQYQPSSPFFYETSSAAAKREAALRPPLRKYATYDSGQNVHYANFSTTPSYTSSHSSSSSVNSTVSGHCEISLTPITRTSPSTDMPRRPALKQNHTWDVADRKCTSKPHVSFLNPNRSEILNMHPLLAFNRFHPAPIVYDVTTPPSAYTLVDRNTRTAVPHHTLSQPATEPPTFTKLTLKSDKFPWRIVAQSPSRPKHRFGVGGSRGSDKPVTNLDLFESIHRALSIRVTQEEWAALGHGSRAQRRATRAYEQRCLRGLSNWNEGVRRMDLLGGKTILIGVEVDRDGEEGRVAKLIFGKA